MTPPDGFRKQNFIEAYGDNNYINTDDYRKIVDNAIKLNGIQAKSYTDAKQKLDSTYNAYEDRKNKIDSAAAKIYEKMAEELENNKKLQEFKDKVNSDSVIKKMELSQVAINLREEIQSVLEKIEAIELKRQGYTDEQILKIQEEREIEARNAINEMNKMKMMSVSNYSTN